MKFSFFENHRHKIIICILAFLSFIGVQILSLCLFCGGFSQLLPVTLPTTVRFVDQKSGDPLLHLPVHFSWSWTEATAQGSGKGGTYFEMRGTTDAKGEIHLPMRVRTFPILFFPFYGRIFEGITIKHGNPQYWLEHKKTNYKGILVFDKPWKYMGGSFSYQISLPRESSDGWAINLSEVAYNFGRVSWQNGFDALLNATGGLNKLSDGSLAGMADSCWYQVDDRCEEVDREIIRRDPNGESFQGIRALTRQSLWSRASKTIGKHMHERAPGSIAWDNEQTILKEYSTVTQLITTSEQIRANENVAKGANRQTKLVASARENNIAGKQLDSITVWLAAEPWLNSDELIEAGRTAQELKLWRLCEYFSRNALKLNVRSADGWELRSISLSKIIESETIIGDRLRTNAAKQAAIRSIKLGGKSGAWLALAAALDHQSRVREAKLALLNAAKLDPNNPEVIRELSRHEFTASETPMKLELPDE